MFRGEVCIFFEKTLTILPDNDRVWATDLLFGQFEAAPTFFEVTVATHKIASAVPFEPVSHGCGMITDAPGCANLRRRRMCGLASAVNRQGANLRRRE